MNPNPDTPINTHADPNTQVRLRVAVVSAGRVGAVLGAALRAAGHTIIATCATSEESRERAENLLPGTPILPAPEAVAAADLVLLAVPDDQLTDLVSGLAATGSWRAGQIVVHTSGAHGLAAVQPAAHAGALTAAIHPAMTFTGWSLDLKRLTGCPFAVTAQGPAMMVAQTLAVEMGGEPYPLADAARPLYHAALNHGANHMTTIIAQALKALTAAGISDPAAFIAPLVHAALERSLQEGPAAVSGPVRRTDAGTVVTNLDALAADPDLTDTAETFSQMSVHTARLLNDADLLSERDAQAIIAAAKLY